MELRCPSSGCHGDLEEFPMESSLTHRRYYCSKCRRPVTQPTAVGKASAVMPLIIGATVILRLIGGDFGGAASDAQRFFDT